MKKKYFFRFFSVTLLSVFLMFIFGIVAVNVNAKTMLQDRLKKEAELVCSLVHTEADFQNFEKYGNDDAFRITVIDLSGNVLYESDSKSPLENHADREEIKNALNGHPETVERYSETFGCDMTYYAIKTALSDGTEIVMRLAVKSSQLNGYLGVAVPILICVLIVSLAASLFLSGVLSKNVSDAVTGIGESLKSLNEGRYVPIETNSSEPELFGVLNEINDLNENTHRHINKISEERNKLNTVLENVSQGIIAVDGNKKILFANKSACEIFDSAGSVLGKDFVYLIDDVLLCDAIACHLGEDYRTEHAYKGKDLSVAIRRTENSDINCEVFSIIIITDVTKEKTLQRQKSDFFANASHEFKTPVTVMQGLSEILLAKDNLDDGSKKQIERVHAESLRLASLISDMLDLSKLENGEYSEQALTPVDLRVVSSEVFAELSEEIKSRRLSTEIVGEGTVLADNAKIYELIQNLCSNAVHYNKENGKIKVEISVAPNGVTLKVSDTGIGIEKEHLPRLCERFYRVDKSRSKKTGGTGLGLAIVKHICALYNAKLSIDSENGLGTTVTVVFPAG